MIDNHDDSDEIDLPVLPAFARLHPNDHSLAVIAAGFGESGQVVEAGDGVGMALAQHLAPQLQPRAYSGSASE